MPNSRLTLLAKLPVETATPAWRSQQCHPFSLMGRMDDGACCSGHIHA